MLCIIYSMCLFFTAFYRAIFLKSIQLHCEMVVCAAQERKKKEKKESHWKKCFMQRQKGQQNQMHRWHRTNKRTESTANGCRSIHLSTQRVQVLQHRPNWKKKKISSRQLHAGIFLWFFFQYTLVVFPALYTRGRTSGSACFGLNETTFKKFHKDVMHLRYSITLKGSKKKEKDRAKHINYALHNGQENERHYTQLAVT